MAVQGVAWGISIAGWIMSPIISKLLDKVLSHCKSDKAETLRRLLTDVLPRLTLTLEAAEAINHSKLFEEMARGLKSAFYDMEDILDELEYIRHQKKMDAHNRSKSQNRRKRLKIISDAEAGPSNQDICIEPSLTLTGTLNASLKDSMATIEELIVKAQGIIELAESSSKGKTVTAKNIHARTTSAPVEMVTGRDEDRDWITGILHDTKDDFNPSSSNNKCFSVIGIYGISGSGKTTLAQYVCKYEENENYFDLVMWIHVSQNYSVGDIFKEMYEAASVDKNKACPEYNSLDVLEKELEKKLKDKKFLLVLDDIWCNKDVGQQQLAKLLSPLKVGKKGSKILATSRNKDAFSDLGPSVACNVFPIRDLDDQAFLALFMYYALEGANLDDPDLIELRIIGAEIAQKLKGSPLAASTVGGQLRKRQNDVEFWRDVRDRELLNETTGALWWSYQHLDEQVRRCFAYCSIFPRRHQLNCDELVKLWVAEGFIQTTNADEDMEAVGRDYFHELLATSFVQPGGYIRGTLCYFVHDLMHDLAEKAAGSDCFRIENGLRGEIPRDVRHLFVANAAMVTDEIFELENLRTLIIDGMEWLGPVTEKIFEKVFGKLKKLRVLDIQIKTVAKFTIPSSIGHLKYLRYIALRMNVCSLILPVTLSKLYHLQVLICGIRNKLEFPPDKNMGNLTNLRHIIGKIEVPFPNIGRLTSLQTLEGFSVSTEQEYSLKQLRDLNKLRGCLSITNLQNVKSKEEAHEAKLADKKQLTGLSLLWDYNRNCTPEVQAEVLEGLCPPKDLKRLEIHSYWSPRYPNWMVGEQNSGPKYLCTLVLGGCNRLEAPSPQPFEFFIHLRELVIMFCCWYHLPDNVKDLRLLKSLKLQHCFFLKSLPEMPQSLEKFEVYSCDQLFMRSCKQIGHPNWQKIQHVGVKIIRVFESSLPLTTTA